MITIRETKHNSAFKLCQKDSSAVNN